MANLKVILDDIHNKIPVSARERLEYWRDVHEKLCKLAFDFFLEILILVYPFLQGLEHEYSSLLRQECNFRIGWRS